MGITQRVRQRRAGDPLVPFRQSCRISMPRWRERRRRRRVPRAVCAYGCSDARSPLVRFDNHAESMPRWRVPPVQGDHAAHIDAFKAVIGCIEIIAKDHLGISVSYVIQRVHDSPVEIMGPAAERLGMGISVSWVVVSASMGSSAKVSLPCASSVPDVLIRSCGAMRKPGALPFALLSHYEKKSSVFGAAQLGACIIIRMVRFTC